MNFKTLYSSTRFVCSYDRNVRISHVIVSLKPGSPSWSGEVSLLAPGGNQNQNLICGGRGCPTEQAISSRGIIIEKTPFFNDPRHSCTKFDSKCLF